MRLLEDMLTPEELEAIEHVSSSENPCFDFLVKLSGLDPAQDFTYSDLRRLNMCGADLRGFNFTGSDLTHCVKNPKTLIDDTTIFTDTVVDWIDLEALPIVEKMQEIEAASGSQRRLDLLNELVGEFGRSKHVITYMVTAASNAHSLDEFIDFAMFLPPQLSKDQAERLRRASLKLLKKKLSKSKSRTRRDTTTIFAVENITSRLENSSETLAARLFGHLAEIVNMKHQTVQLGGTAHIDRADLEKAFSKIGQ
jgi:hypothetical protein